MSTIQKSGQKSAAPVAKVIPAGAVAFVRPGKAEDRQSIHHEAVTALRQETANREKSGEHIIVRLIQVLAVAPDNGSDSDALDALRTGEQAVPGLTSKDVSMARAGWFLCQRAGITSTADDLFPNVLTTVRRVGRGKDSIAKVLGRKQAGTVRSLLAGTTNEETGRPDEGKIRDTFPTSRDNDGGTVGSKGYKAAHRAYEALSEAADLTPEQGGMTPDERKTVATLLTRLADRLSKPAVVKGGDKG